LKKILPPEIKIAKEATITMGGSAIAGVLRYVFNILIARLLGIEMLGFYAISNAVTQIASVMGKLGLDTGIVRYVSRLQALNKLDVATATIRRAVLIGVVSAVFMAVLLYLGAGKISVAVFHASPALLGRLLSFFVLAIPFIILAQILVAGSQGLGVLKHPALALYIIPATVLCIGLVLTVPFFSPVDVLIVSFWAAQVLSAIVAFFLVKRFFPLHKRPGVPPAAGLVRFSLPLAFASILTMIIHWSDILMIGALADGKSAGLYQPAVRTAGMIILILHAFNSIFAPVISDLEARGDRTKIQRLLKLVSRWNFTVAWPAFLFLGLYAPMVMAMFGDNFLPASNVVRLLALTQATVALGTSSAAVLTMSGFHKTNLYNNSLALLINVGANLYLIPRYGIMGAALGTAVAMLTLTVMRLAEIKIYLHMHPFTLKYAKPFIAGLVGWGSCALINRLAPDLPTVVHLLGGMALYSGIYLGALYLLGFDEDDKSVLQAVRRKLKRGFA